MEINVKNFLSKWEENYKMLIEMRTVYGSLALKYKRDGSTELSKKASRDEAIIIGKIEGMKIALIGLGYVCDFVDGECHFIDIT